jgi:ABC-type glycerol-3-phosphate transport system substrate-binding protein
VSRGWTQVTTEGCIVIKKICAVAALTAAVIFGSAGTASADAPGTEFRGWTWWLGTEVVEIVDDVADALADGDDGVVTILRGWTWW